MFTKLTAPELGAEVRHLRRHPPLRVSLPIMLHRLATLLVGTVPIETVAPWIPSPPPEKKKRTPDELKGLGEYYDSLEWEEPEGPV